MGIDYYRQYEPIFGSWYIKRQLGSGSYGRVFEIVREEYGETFQAALKAISIPPEESEWDGLMRSEGFTEKDAVTYYREMVEGYTKEFVLMSKLKGNSNIVSYEDHKVIEHSDGKGWDILIRMELLTPLYDYLENHAIDERDVLRLGKDICRALELCEKNNIIHRDIKPENIFVSHTGSFKLGGFGIARITERSMGASTHAGSPDYRAPEIEKGIRGYDNRVDIYSIGIVMYWLLNGKRMPFLPPRPNIVTHKDKKIAYAKRIAGDYPLPAPTEASEEISKVVLKACAFKPEDRFCSAMEMRIEIEKVEENANYMAGYFDDKYDIEELDESEENLDYKKSCSDNMHRGYYTDIATTDYLYKETIKPAEHLQERLNDGKDESEIDRLQYKNKRKKWFLIAVILEILALVAIIYSFVINPSVLSEVESYFQGKVCTENIGLYTEKQSNQTV